MMQNVLHAILHHTKNKDNLDFGFRRSLHLSLFPDNLPKTTVSYKYCKNLCGCTRGGISKFRPPTLGVLIVDFCYSVAGYEMAL